MCRFPSHHNLLSQSDDCYCSLQQKHSHYHFTFIRLLHVRSVSSLLVPINVRQNFRRVNLSAIFIQQSFRRVNISAIFINSTLPIIIKIKCYSLFSPALGAISPQTRLYAALMENYNKNIIPRLNPADRVDVTVDFKLQKLASIVSLYFLWWQFPYIVLE